MYCIQKYFRSEEFEFHWWDHLFNTAAKGVTVNNPDEKGGELTVSFQADKSERSAKKLRRKMQKEMKNRLYSRFVRAGTLKGDLEILLVQLEILRLGGPWYLVTF